MDASTAFAVYALAAMIFALPAFIVGVFAYVAVAGIVAVARHFITRKPVAAPAVYIDGERVEATVIPEGMTRDEFDAWWAANVAA